MTLESPTIPNSSEMYTNDMQRGGVKRRGEREIKIRLQGRAICGLNTCTYVESGIDMMITLMLISKST